MSQETQNFDKARENDDKCTCCLCRWDCTYYLKKSTGAKWINCCFSLLWYHNQCINLADDFNEDVCLCVRTLWTYILHCTLPLFQMWCITPHHQRPYFIYTLIAIKHYLHKKFSIFNVVNIIHFSSTELQILSYVWEPFALKFVKQQFIKIQEWFILEPKTWLSVFIINNKSSYLLITCNALHKILKSKTGHGLRQPYHISLYKSWLLSGMLWYPFFGFPCLQKKPKHSTELWKMCFPALSTLILKH